MRRVRNAEVMKLTKDPALAALVIAPDAEIYAIDVSFSQLKDKAELAFLNQQPTSVVLTPEAVDRLRAAAGVIIAESPEFKRLVKDVGGRIVVQPAPASSPVPAR